jgi:hypothetical protein
LERSSSQVHGLEIARRFFLEWGQPFLRRRFPALAERMAAGLFRGSQVLGADDGWSRDHGWGPMFVLLLPEPDYAAKGADVESTLSAEAPREWLGYRTTFPATNVEVSTVDRYCAHWLGFTHPPTDWHAWLGGTPHSGAREHELYLIRHGQVFADPLGELEARRVAVAHYPEPAWLHRVWEETFNIWHYGQYNLCERLVHRNDPVTTQIALGRFVEAVMRLGLLLDRDYTPYWKWLAHEFRKHPVATELDARLRQLCDLRPRDEQARRVDEICRIAHELLDAAGLASPDLSRHPHPLFCDQAGLRERLDDVQADV